MAEQRLRVAVVEKHLQKLKDSGELQIRPVPYFKPKIRTKRHNPYEDGIRKYELNGRGIYRRDWDQWYYSKGDPVPEQQVRPKRQQRRVRVTKRAGAAATAASATIDTGNGQVTARGGAPSCCSCAKTPDEADTSLGLNGMNAELRLDDRDNSNALLHCDTTGEQLRDSVSVVNVNGSEVEITVICSVSEQNAAPHSAGAVTSNFYYSDIDSGFAELTTVFEDATTKDGYAEVAHTIKDE